MYWEVICASFLLQSLHKILPSTTSYYKACTKYFPVHPGTTSYYKACTKYFPVLLRTTKLAQSTSQYYFLLQSLHMPAQSISQYHFVLQSLHKVLPSTTSYYKACTKYFPVLLRTTELAQIISQYYAAFRQPLQCDSRLLDAKHKSNAIVFILTAVAARNLDAAIPMRSADIELQNAIEVRATTRTNCSDLQLQNRISTPKQKNDDFSAF